MRVVGLPSDLGGCGELRIIQPVTAAGGAVALEIPAVWRDLPDDGRVAVEVLVDADVVILQRVMSDDTLSAVRQMKRQGIAVVLDIDDDFMEVHPNNQAYYQTHPDWITPEEHDRIVARVGSLGQRRRVTIGDQTFIHCPAARPSIRRENLLIAARTADLVTTSTPALAKRYGVHTPATVVRNGVPASWLGAGTDGNALAWTAHLGTHPADLDDLGDSVARALDDTGMRFRTPDSGGAAEKLGLTRRQWRKLDWVDFARYHEIHSKGIRVGMVPLAHDLFNEAKSWLKGLEFSAWGLPWVATPTSEYRALHALGAGALADTPEQWRSELVALATNDDRRAEAIGAGLDVALNWTIEKRVGHWVDAWTMARRNADARVAKQARSKACA